MPTTSLPQAHYASGISRSDTTQASKPSAKNSTQTNSTETKTETAPRTRGPFLLDNALISFYRHGEEKEEKSFMLGLAVDVYKNVAKILNGSMLTDVVKTLNKNGNLTWQEAIYKSFMDSGPSRIINDIANSFMVRFFNGNHSFFGLFALPYLAPEISSQIMSIPLVTALRALTSGFNVNNKSAQKDQSDQEADIKEQINEKKGFALRFQNYMSSDVMDKIKPGLDSLFSYMGIHAGKNLTDKEGNFIPRKDFNGEIEIDKKNDAPKSLKENERINGTLLGGLMAGTFLGSFFLPKHTAAFGFEKAKSLGRVVGSTVFTSLCRLNTTLLHNGMAMHLDSGKNFDACFNISVIEKMLVPFTQYASDAIGSYLSKSLNINGAALAMTLRLITEIPSTYLSNGIINISKSDRMVDSWTYLSHKFWKPTAKFIENTTKPIFKFLAKNVYGQIGMFDKSIPNMYDVDVRLPEFRDKLMPKHLAAKYDKGSTLSDLILLARKTLEMPLDLFKLGRNVQSHAKKYEDHIAKQLQEANEKVDIRRATEEVIAASPDAEIRAYEPSNDNPKFNRELMHMLAENRIPEAKSVIAEKTKLPEVSVETDPQEDAKEQDLVATAA